MPFQEKSEIKEYFLKTLEKNRKRDIFKKNTGAGPHRDDWNFSSMTCLPILVAKDNTVV